MPYYALATRDVSEQATYAHPINVVRLDERSKRIFVLIGDTIEVEIFPYWGGEVLIK